MECGRLDSRHVIVLFQEREEREWCDFDYFIIFLWVHSASSRMWQEILGVWLGL
jgi:hypothetical protein